MKFNLPQVGAHLKNIDVATDMGPLRDLEWGFELEYGSRIHEY